MVDFFRPTAHQPGCIEGLKRDLANKQQRFLGTRSASRLMELELKTPYPKSLSLTASGIVRTWKSLHPHVGSLHPLFWLGRLMSAAAFMVLQDPYSSTCTPKRNQGAGLCVSDGPLHQTQVLGQGTTRDRRPSRTLPGDGRGISKDRAASPEGRIRH